MIRYSVTIDFAKELTDQESSFKLNFSFESPYSLTYAIVKKQAYTLARGYNLPEHAVHIRKFSYDSEVVE